MSDTVNDYLERQRVDAWYEIIKPLRRDEVVRTLCRFCSEVHEMTRVDWETHTPNLLP